MEDVGVVVVPKAFPQRALPDIAEGRLLGVRIELVDGRCKPVLTYEAADGEPGIPDAQAGVR